LTEDNEVVVAEIVSKSRHGVGVRARHVGEASDDWTLIDSEETARSFVGATVEVDADATREDEEHRLHGSMVTVRSADASALWVSIRGCGDLIIRWLGRGNVRLRRVTP
jgi:hypothetical protein